MKTSMTAQASYYAGVIEWLNQWAAAIRENDIRKGRRLFSEHASGFGTITYMTNSLDELVERQWTDVWKSTKSFDFDWDRVKIQRSPDGLQAAVQALWSSLNAAGKSRSGRATIILQRASKSDAWKCIHTHFSMRPGGADPGELT